MSTTNFDYCRFRDVPRWSPLPAGAYSLQDVNRRDSARVRPVPAALRSDTASWNLYWVLAPKLGETQLQRLEPRLESELQRLPSKAFSYAGGGQWTLAALMCAYPPAQYMQRYGKVIDALLNLPSGYRNQLER